METLPREVIERVVAGLPQQVRDALMRMGSKPVVAGGMVRDVAAGEPWKDIDLFGSEEPPAELEAFMVATNGVVTDYNIDGQRVQYINTDCSPDVHILERFDFICVTGMVWWEPARQHWVGMAQSGCLKDIKLRRLRLNTHGVHPKAMTRVLKLAERGYKPDNATLARIIAGVVSYTDEAVVHGMETRRLEECLAKVMSEGSSRAPRAWDYDNPAEPVEPVQNDPAQAFRLPLQVRARLHDVPQLRRIV